MTKRQKKNETAVATRVIAYVRVSTEQQASDGASLEQQKARLQMYAELQGLTIVGVEVDAGLSASSLERPGLRTALQGLESGRAEGLLVMKLDRLTRSLRDLALLMEGYFQHRFRLMSVSEQIDTSTAGGRMMLNVLTAISQWEREAAAERTSAVMAHLRATGKYAGGWPPYGWALDEEGGLIPAPEEQAIIARVKELRAAGVSFRAVAAQMTNPRTNRAFDQKQIRRICNQENDHE